MNKRLAHKGSLPAADDSERAVRFLCGYLAASLFPTASFVVNAAGAAAGLLGIVGATAALRAIVGGRRHG